MNELELEKELESLLNRYSVENQSDTPDFILAAYLMSCLDTYKATVRARDMWFGVDSMWSLKRKENDGKI